IRGLSGDTDRTTSGSVDAELYVRITTHRSLGLSWQRRAATGTLAIHSEAVDSGGEFSVVRVVLR
ncbi:MAG TPA: hypothetical protein VGE01_09890, partial [Fimbriimonas sp.]